MLSVKLFWILWVLIIHYKHYPTMTSQIQSVLNGDQIYHPKLLLLGKYQKPFRFPLHLIITESSCRYRGLYSELGWGCWGIVIFVIRFAEKEHWLQIWKPHARCIFSCSYPCAAQTVEMCYKYYLILKFKCTKSSNPQSVILWSVIKASKLLPLRLGWYTVFLCKSAS